MTINLSDDQGGHVTPLVADMIRAELMTTPLIGIDHQIVLKPKGHDLQILISNDDVSEPWWSFDGHSWAEIRSEDTGLDSQEPAIRSSPDSHSEGTIPEFLRHDMEYVGERSSGGSPETADEISDEIIADTIELHAPILDLYETLVATGWNVDVRFSGNPNPEEETPAIYLRANPPDSDRLRSKPVIDAFEGVPTDPIAVVTWTRTRSGGWWFDATRTGFLSETDAILDRSAQTLLDYALATAPDWALAPGVDKPIRREPYTSIHPSVALTSPPAPGADELVRRQRRISEWAAEHQFSEEVQPARPAAVAPLLERLGHGSAGYYLLEFADGQCYVGQSVAIDKRLAQHLRNHPDIVSIRVRPDGPAGVAANPLRHLLGNERELIHAAQRAGLHARNKSEMTVILGHANVNVLIPVAEQTRWLANPDEGNIADVRDGRQLRLPPTFAGASKNLLTAQALLGHDEDRAVHLLRRYLTRCIPLPNATEGHYWNISAPKRAYRGDPKSWRTVWCFTIGLPETFVMLRNLKTGNLEGFLQVNGTELYRDADPDTGYVRVQRQHPGCEIRGADYKDSGPDNLTVHFPNLSALERLLEDTQFTRAAATAALLLMRVRKAPKTRQQTHCPELVSEAWAAGSR